MKRVKVIFTVLILSIANYLFAQNVTVSGTVVEKGNGLPIPSVSIIVKGTKVGASTDVDGKYTLNVPSNGILTFSFIGFKTVEIPVNGRKIINIELEQDAVNLGEVVMIAYGTAKKESVTGAVSTVNTKSIEKRPVSTVSAVLEGQAAGVQVNNTYGEPGTDPTVIIRGFSSINGSNTPLYVVDGVPYGGNVSDLNPYDIENITVLKDAASSALFGNRASNGVIMITTKKGKSERTSIRASINQGFFARGIKEYEKLGTNDYMEIMWKGYRNHLMTSNPTLFPTKELAGAEATKSLIPTYLKYNLYNMPDNQLFDSNGKLVQGATIRPGYDDLDWFKFIERVGYRQDYVISGEGASEKNNYFFSVGYLDEKGYLKSSDFNRLTGRASVSVTPKKWIKAGFNISGSFQVANSTTGDADNSAKFNNPFNYARNMAPIYPVYLHDMATGEYLLNANGERQYDSGNLYTRPQNLGRHIVWEYDLNLDRTYRTTLSSQAYVDITFLKDFTFSIKGDLNLRNFENQSYQNAEIGDGLGQGRAYRTINRYKNYTVQEILTYKKEFGDHNFELMAAHENYSYNQTYLYGGKTKETFKGGKELINFNEILALTGYQRDYRTESYLSRIRYNYSNKYFFDASIRRDGSSKFIDYNRWGNFWSMGGSWTISKENFMTSVKDYINNLKLRASYGQVGNDGGIDYLAIDFNAYMALYSMQQNGNLGAAYKIQNEAKDIVWESSNSFGVALEGRFFNRLNLSLEYFDKRSKDLLFDVYLPLSAGATSTTAAEATIKKNLGSVSNRGVEIVADADIISYKSFKWNFGINTTLLKNKIVNLPDQNRENGIVSGTKRYFEGHDRYDFWLYQFVGVDQMTGKSLYLPDLDRFYIDTPEAGKTQLPSQYVVKVNDKYYTTYTTYGKKDWSGSAIPKLFGSFSTTLSYKDIDLSVLCTYSIGGKTLDYSYQDLMSVTTNPNSLHKDLLKSWDGAPEGMTETSINRIDPKGIPAVNYGLSTYNDALSNRFLLDGSYLIVKNISLGYRLPKSILSKIDISEASLNFSVDNLATFSAKRGMNPQQSFSGINDNAFVTARVFSVGLSVKL